MNAPAVVWEGAESLRPALVPVTDLREREGNPRRGDVQEIARSLQRWGQMRAVLSDPDGVIVAGHHIWKAAQRLGWTHVAAVRNEFSSEEEARAYLLADNRLGDQGEYERSELVLFLEDLEQAGRWEGTGYQQDDLEQLRKLEQLAAVPPPEAPVFTPAPPPPELREVVLLLDDEQHEGLVGGVRVLRDKYGLEGVTETILAAVEAEALRLNQGKAE